MVNYQLSVISHKNKGTVLVKMDQYVGFSNFHLLKLYSFSYSTIFVEKAYGIPFS